MSLIKSDFREIRIKDLGTSAVLLAEIAGFYYFGVILGKVSSSLLK